MLYLAAVQTLGVFLSQMIENQTAWAWSGMFRVRFSYLAPTKRGKNLGLTFQLQAIEAPNLTSASHGFGTGVRNSCAVPTTDNSKMGLDDPVAEFADCRPLLFSSSKWGDAGKVAGKCHAR